MLRWVGRLRVVSSRELSVRFAVSEQRANARVRRLLSAGLLAEHGKQVWRSERRLVYVTSRGAGAVGLPRRRPPSPELDVARELTIRLLLGTIETTAPDVVVLTERDARRRERDGESRLSFDDRRRRRFPALVLETVGGRRAVELELFFKPRKRLQAIVESAAYGDAFEEAVWLVATTSQKARIQKLINRTRPLSWLRSTHLAVHCLSEWSAEEMAGMLAAPPDRPPARQGARAM